MGRGRKSTAFHSNSDWEKVFYNSVGTYVQIINNNLSKQFKVEPLSNHIKILGGYSFKNSEYKRQGVPIIRISDFNNEKVILNDVVYYSESAELKKYELVEGDIIIALTGGTIAKLAIVQAGLSNLYLNQRVGKFHILNPDLFEKEYVYWIARSVQSIIKNLAWGAAIPNVSPKQIESLEFPIPERKCQRGIINFLNDLKDNNINGNTEYFDSSIENEILSLHEKQIITESLSFELQSQSKLVKKLLQQILQDAVQGKLVPQEAKDEPATVLIEKIKAEKEKLIKKEKLKKQKQLPPIREEEIPFDIPKNWAWGRLGEIAMNIEYGSSEKADIIPEGIPILRMNNIIEGKIDFDKLKYVKKTISDLPNLFLVNGDLLFNRTNSYELVGKSGVYKERDNIMTFASYLIRVQFSSFISPEYINYYINSSICRSTQIEPDIIQQNGQANFNGSKLKNIICPIPPLNEQKRIVKKAEDLLQLCDELDKEIKQNQKLSQQLLQSALKEALEPKIN
jgi:type I restriction enzyme S subunit